jgi:short-subunit dehydrogenase
MILDSTCTALVTGANGGIGRAIARALHALSVKVTVSGRRADALAGIAAEVGARVLVADLAERDDVAKLADDAGDVDVLVANAALPASGPLLEFAQDDIDRALDVTLRAPMALARRIVPDMVRRGRGHVVVISSLAGKVASPGSALYSATKFGLRGFALGLRQDLAGTGVGVSAVFPGFIRDAGMFAEAGVALPAGVGTRTPEDVAAAVLRAVRDDEAEIDVASVEQRVGALIAGISPTLSSRIQGAIGAAALSRKLSEGQRHKR